ncbi:hypothetical protein DL767_003317 [Monosporascus sp. MG133]|nr:hypothetical protein DL767_003317 [Monosporascus sp. MG133]
MHVLPLGYLKALKRHYEKRGMLLIADEAQTGVGRNGDIMTIMHEGVIHRVCTEKDYCFYTTHVNDPLPAAVGDKVLEVAIHDNLIWLHRRHPGEGSLMAGVEIVADRDTKAPAIELAQRLADRAYELGVWANLPAHPAFSGTLRIAPPITITR